MAMADYRPPGAYNQFNPKPLPATNRAPMTRNRIQPLTKVVPEVALPEPKPQQTASTYSTFPRKSSQGSPSNPQVNTSRRTPSTSTTSTTGGPSRTLSSSSTVLSRTASTRSGASTTPSSYVALMRKQKATVWCDRSQHEDPRLLAAQKAAKARAVREVSGHFNNIEGRTSTSGSMGSGSLGVRSKIRHHGIPKASNYSYANMIGGGVPMRLSANEVENEGVGDDDSLRGSHGRTGSGRSSMNRDKYLTVQRSSNRYSEGSTPTSSYDTEIPELETPVPGHHQTEAKGDYFTQKSGNGGSDSSSQEESKFGHVGQLKAPTARREEGKSAEELRRRGSVDERANTMGSLGGVRLFVANPDLSD